MEASQMPYVHLLQFLCRRCGQPLVIPVRSEAANLEKVDADSHSVKCQCGWLGSLLGVEAVRHWVTPWHHQQNVVDYLQGTVFNEKLSNSR